MINWCQQSIIIVIFNVGILQPLPDYTYILNLVEMCGRNISISFRLFEVVSLCLSIETIFHVKLKHLEILHSRRIKELQHWKRTLFALPKSWKKAFSSFRLANVIGNMLLIVSNATIKPSI